MSAGALAEGLLETLTADAESEARSLVDRARSEADRIALDAAAHLRETLDERVAARADELAVSTSVRRLRAKETARRSALDARQTVVNRVLDTARAMLAQASTAEWLKGEIDRALSYLPEGKAHLRCAPRDVARIRNLVADRPATTVAADDAIAAGLIAEMADGSLLVDATLDSRIGRMHAELAIEIVTAVEGTS
jgi:vacuolar-type H+-ATPase subunit E/Vma4